MDLKRRTATWQRGLGDGFSLAVEFVAAPLIFAALGWWLDSRFGTSPVLAVDARRVRLRGRASCAPTTRTWPSMEYEEKDKPWTRSRR